MEPNSGGFVLSILLHSSNHRPIDSPANASTQTRYKNLWPLQKGGNSNRGSGNSEMSVCGLLTDRTDLELPGVPESHDLVPFT
jgi:hypothetical protein